MGSTLEVHESIAIAQPAAKVRQQFADVAHHAKTGLHRGVTFEVITDDEEACRYRQRTRVGPIRLTQVMHLPRSSGGPLVNTIEKGQFSTGSITFVVSENGADNSIVEATLRAPLKGPQRMVSPLLRSNVSKALKRALAEDKADLESGAYSQARTA